MRKPEQQLNDRIRDNIRKLAGENIIMERIENAVAAGTPDTVVLARETRHVIFAEHKVADWPARQDRPIKFLHPPTQPQLNWHKRWTQAGGSSIFIIGMRGPAGLFVWPGESGDFIRDVTGAVAKSLLLDYSRLIKVYLYGTRGRP